MTRDLEQGKGIGKETDMDMDMDMETGKGMGMENQFGAHHHIVMDEQYLQVHDVIQRYIRHQLQADELAAFEILLIANPALIEQVETQRLINATFKQELAASKYQSAALLKLRPLMRRLLPIAATLVLGLFIGLKTFDKPAPVIADGPVIVAETLVLEGLRGSPQQYTVDLSALLASSAAASRVLLPLRIDVGPQLTAEQRYQLQLVGEAGDSVLANAASLASVDGWLAWPVELPANTRGLYLVRITQLPLSTVTNNGVAIANNDQQRYLLNFR